MARNERLQAIGKRNTVQLQCGNACIVIARCTQPDPEDLKPVEEALAASKDWQDVHDHGEICDILLHQFECMARGPSYGAEVKWATNALA
jgi:hypothetical protein